MQHINQQTAIAAVARCDLEPHLKAAIVRMIQRLTPEDLAEFDRRNDWFHGVLIESFRRERARRA